MTILPKLEQDLVAASRRRLDLSDEQAAPTGAEKKRRGQGRLRAALVAAVIVLASASIALAATGVIPIGRSVHPQEVLNPAVGEGLPAPGGSRLLPLRVADPEGGPPWAMRIVRTTRGEVCVQIGRIENGKLGELGIDGNFRNDGRFHPIPVNALPRDAFRGRVYNTLQCALDGTAVVAEVQGQARGGAPATGAKNVPLSHQRDIYYGLLGPHALGITYTTDGASRTQPLVPGVGAYLLVAIPKRQRQAGAAASFGTPDSVAPMGPITAITYRLHGRLCQRGPSVAPWETSHIGHPCPTIQEQPQTQQTLDLHVPLRVRLHASHGGVVAVTLAFKAPFAVRSAHSSYSYSIETPQACEPHKLINGKVVAIQRGGTSEVLQRDVRRGETITWHIPDPFGVDCGRHSITLRVTYNGGDVGAPALFGRHPGGYVVVGTATLDAPSGVHPK